MPGFVSGGLTGQELPTCSLSDSAVSYIGYDRKVIPDKRQKSQIVAVYSTLMICPKVTNEDKSQLEIDFQ